MHVLAVGLPVVEPQTDVTSGTPELRMDLLPLADARVVEELLATLASEAARRAGCPLGADVFPQLQPGHEVRALDLEALVLFRGELFLTGGTFPRIAHRETGGDDEYLVQTVVVGTGQHHPTDARIDRQTVEATTQLRQPAVLVGRTQLVQERETVTHRAGVGRVDEREPVDVAETGGLHPEDDRGEVGALDLRLGELGPVEVVVLVVEPDGDAGTESAASAGPLVRRGLRDRLDGQPLHLGPSVEP